MRTKFIPSNPASTNFQGTIARNYDYLGTNGSIKHNKGFSQRSKISCILDNESTPYNRIPSVVKYMKKIRRSPDFSSNLMNPEYHGKSPVTVVSESFNFFG